MASSTSDRIYQLSEQVATLQKRLAGPGSHAERQFAEALAGLQTALQELEVAEEELAQQNEELITTRERLEMERHRYRDLFELAPDGYVVTDAAGTIEEANRAACALLGTSETALRGKPFTVFVPLEEKSRYRSMLRGVETQVLRDVELVLQPPGARPVHTLLTVVQDERKVGQPARLRWVLRDVSARLKTEAALRDSEERLRHSQRLESVGRLAGGIAHSFNNLLAAIGFHSELLLDSVDGSERVHVDEIRKAGERAARLAGQLLAFSRRQVLQPRVLRLDDVLRQMAPMLQRLLGEDVEVRMDLRLGTGAVVADLGQLEQVILNLAVNARDAMPYGGTLTVATQGVHLDQQAGPAQLPAGDYVRLVVADTGSGMDQEILGRAFEPFFTTKELGKGTGLGLSTVHGIVLQSGGDIRVESTPGVGTVFTILLPRAEATAEPEPERSTAPGESARGSETLLLVEDEDNIRGPAMEILESRGYTVLAACNAAEALVKAERHDGPLHLLVTDVVMPGMSGSQLAEHLARLRPAVKVLYMSGYPEDAISHHGVLAPGQRFLQKPFAVGLLLRTVRELLDGVEGPAAQTVQES